MPPDAAAADARAADGAATNGATAAPGAAADAADDDDDDDDDVRVRSVGEMLVANESNDFVRIASHLQNGNVLDTATAYWEKAIEEFKSRDDYSMMTGFLVI